MYTPPLPPQVFVAPAAYYVAQPTDAPPVPITPEPVQYWIIGAVLGPVAFVVIILVLVLLYWRWKKGAPQTKVEPETMQMMKRDRAKMVRRCLCFLRFFWLLFNNNDINNINC